jgi:hypothetical protein
MYQSSMDGNIVRTIMSQSPSSEYAVYQQTGHWWLTNRTVYMTALFSSMY